jgi:MinD superfamily P-loop ATPase
MATPLIRQMKKSLPPADMVLLDAPPGAACAMIEAVREVDYVVLVSEPTPFGSGDDALEEYCLSRGVPIIAKIPYSRKIAEAYSRGELFYNLFPDLAKIVDDLGVYLREGGWKA